MKSNTEVFIALRNIGDSNDDGKLFQGSLRDSLAWLINHLGEITMATRIAIGIGRNEAGAKAAIESKRQSGASLTNELQSMLDGLMEEDQSTPETLPGDTWKGTQP